ncbi:probable isoaspartyl peptidase/L-asparaginase 2 [Dendrobium catenatum]|uniref:probable isoaspartyl peptidase/L-asparaginase 2 n=1 Tax=Dendrobium catenatum TaxID=906689 RepID=UPI0010A00083|nr:probable isoaspartyl peptidase/L-asparaginase 2 [Dendrobium catenatum]
MGGWAIAVHGGAGVDSRLPEERQAAAKRLLAGCLEIGADALRSGAMAIDVVEMLVRELETDPFFNSGRGSALTARGTVEMEASIMNGPDRRCGAVSGITTVKNPVSLARRVMEFSPHSYLAFQGAEDFAIEQASYENPFILDRLFNGGLPIWTVGDGFAKNGHVGFRDCKFYLKQFDYRVATDTCSGSVGPAMSFDTGIQMNGLPISVYAPETVGCVVVDSTGGCAAATSTGGLMNKKCGRIGDSPLIGAGTYACDLCAVSCTGEGEAIIRATLARDVAAIMEYKGLALQEAVNYAIKERLDGGKAGVIAVSKDGEVAYGFNSNGMFRGCATEDGFMEVGIWE